MEQYSVDGAAASIAPYSQRWRDIEVGTDGTGAPIYSGYKEVDLLFPVAHVEDHKQWIDAVDGASHTLDILDQSELNYITVSPVFLVAQQRPDVQARVSGEFIITVRGVRPL